MKKALISLLVIVIAVLGDDQIAVATDTGLEDSVVICSNQDNRRIVTLDYLVPGNRVPCRVIYEKPTEKPGFSQILWSAENKVGYCEDKMDDFIHKKLEGKWGWQCSSREQSMVWQIPERRDQVKTWYVILGGFPQTQEGLNSGLQLRDKFRSDIWTQDDFSVGESDFYSELTDGLYVVMKGPFQNQIDAENWAKTDAVRDIVSNASVQQIVPKKGL